MTPPGKSDTTSTPVWGRAGPALWSRPNTGGSRIVGFKEPRTVGPQALVLHMNRTCSMNAEQHYMIFQECCRGVSISTSRIFRKDQVEVVQMKAMECGAHQGTKPPGVAGSARDPALVPSKQPQRISLCYIKKTHLGKIILEICEKKKGKKQPAVLYKPPVWPIEGWGKVIAYSHGKIAKNRISYILDESTSMKTRTPMKCLGLFCLFFVKAVQCNKKVLIPRFSI